MGKYADKIKTAQQNMSPADIRAAKVARSKERNTTRKAERRLQAEERQSGWASLGVEKQLKVLKGRPGQSKRQVARLTNSDR